MVTPCKNFFNHSNTLLAEIPTYGKTLAVMAAKRLAFTGFFLAIIIITIFLVGGGGGAGGEGGLKIKTFAGIVCTD